MKKTKEYQEPRMDVLDAEFTDILCQSPQSTLDGNLNEWYDGGNL